MVWKEDGKRMERGWKEDGRSSLVELSGRNSREEKSREAKRVRSEVK
jgi:hypothetical protein